MNQRNQANQIYEQIKEKLKGWEGKFVAIDVESGDYFLGANPLEAHKKGQKKHPYKKFFYKRVGSKAAFVVGVLKR